MNTRTSLDISHALTIPGWMSESELLWLASQAHANPTGTFVEVGTYLGRSAAAIASQLTMIDDRGDFGILLCVDPYTPYDDPVIGRVDQGEMDRLSLVAENNLRTYIEKGAIVTHRVSSTDMVYNFDPRSVDFVFLDGNHTYPSVMADIQSWLPKIRPRGILCGHDYTTYESVRRAVDGSFRPSMIQRPAGSLWAVTIPVPEDK